MISISLFYCCKKLVTWMVGKMKHHYLKNKIFTVRNAAYTHRRRVSKCFEMKNLAKYHDMYVQSDTLLSVDVFENFPNICLEIYGLDTARSLTAPGLAWQASFKRTKVKLDLLTVIDILLMVEKGIRSGICHAIHQYANASIKGVKYYDSNEE